MDGPAALSLGRPRKSVLRIGIEHAAVDVLQWLTCADDAPAHVGLPLAMPADSGSAVAALHRALHAALREGWQQRAVTQMALEEASAVVAAAAPTAAAAAAASHALDLRGGGEGGRDALSEASECVVCFAAARDCVLVPCGHAHVCMQCGGTLASCPMCRSPVERAIRLYE